MRERALELLKQAAQSLPECGETWYLLGRYMVYRHYIVDVCEYLCVPVSVLFCVCVCVCVCVCHTMTSLPPFPSSRVLVTHQKYHEAFSAYQKTIHCPSKISPANTWHSIG